MTFYLAVILFILDLLFVFVFIQNTFAQIFLLPAIFLFIPIYVLIANWLLTPYFEWIKKRIRKKAARKVSALKDLKVVIVAGSFGKTSVKNFTFQLTRYVQKTQMIPGNINTPAGIATWVLNNLTLDTKLLIAEVDTYEVGEIARSCEILKADIAVIRKHC